jgi:hypothetical protein
MRSRSKRLVFCVRSVVRRSRRGQCCNGLYGASQWKMLQKIHGRRILTSFTHVNVGVPVRELYFLRMINHWF